MVISLSFNKKKYFTYWKYVSCTHFQKHFKICEHTLIVKAQYRTDSLLFNIFVQTAVFKYFLPYF